MKEEKKKRWYERFEEEHHNFMMKSPFIYNLYWVVAQTSILVSLLVVFYWMYISIGVAYPLEMEGRCNADFIGIDYEMEFRNEEYNDKDVSVYSMNRTRYWTENYPKHLNLKNIHGLNCNFRMKGEFPLNIIRKFGG